MTIPTLAQAIPILREVLCDDKGHTTEELVGIVCKRFETTEEEKLQMSEGRKCSAPIAVWVATATLHRRRGNDGQFAGKEILKMVMQQRICDVEIGTVLDNIRTHCVANSPAGSPSSSKQCKLFRVDKDKYRLCRRDDVPCPDRRGGQKAPNSKELPPEYKDLLAWYNDVYNKKQS